MEKKEATLQTLSSSKATVEIKRLQGLPATKSCLHRVPFATVGSLGTEHKCCGVLPNETHSGWDDIIKRALIIHRCHSELPQREITPSLRRQRLGAPVAQSVSARAVLIQKTATSECLTLTGHLYHSPKGRIMSGKGGVGSAGTRSWGRGL